MKRDIKLYLNDILESIERIEEYTLELDQEEFHKDKLIQDAVFRRLEIIGEAVKNLPSKITDKYPKIPWKEIAGLMDVLSHAYFGISIERVWKVITEDIQELKKNILEIKNSH